MIKNIQILHYEKFFATTDRKNEDLFDRKWGPQGGGALIYGNVFA